MYTFKDIFMKQDKVTEKFEANKTIETIYDVTYKTSYIDYQTNGILFRYNSNWIFIPYSNIKLISSPVKGQ